ncbi:MAG TPA: rhodanese-like domain-containing protein [Chloroflexota bacterium]|jgi:rhodanese-related sulfurtransferase
MPTDLFQRDEVQRLRDAGALIVEVLPREEYDHEHLPGAISLPLRDLTPQHAEHTLSRDRPIVVYCQDVT